MPTNRTTTRVTAVISAAAAVAACAAAASSGNTGGDRQKSLSAPSASQQPGPTGGIALFNGRDFSGWTYYLDNKNARWQDTWSIDPVEQSIRCKGQPAGYIRTVRPYKNYVLRLQWRFAPGRAGNSGVLLRLVGRDKVWPRSVEAQLQSGAAGDFWLIDGAHLDTPPERVDKGTPRHRLRTRTNEKPLGEWNDYEITCNGGNISLKVNGEVLNEGTNAEAFRGPIALQSEGAEIYFRNIRLTPLPD